MANSATILLVSSSRVGERAFLVHPLRATDAALGGTRHRGLRAYALARLGGPGRWTARRRLA